jgi:hypothetical protein
VGAIATLLRLALAASLSAASAGLLGGLALFFGMRLDGPSGGGAGLSDLASMASFGATMGLLVATLPAFLAGAALWGLSRHNRSARHALAWVGAGAAVGACLWILFELSFRTPGRHAYFAFAELGLLLACLIAGAGGALTFRAAMKCTDFLNE